MSWATFGGFLSSLGIKLVPTVAGFAGGVVSLAFIQNLTKPQAVMSVVVGLLSANYLNPVAVAKLSITPDLQGGSAFVIGLCAMSIIPIIKKAVPSLASLIAGHVGSASTDPSQGKGDSTK
ncbi:MAG: hypothetical protein WA777_20075 [Rhodanobacter sp.]